MRDRCWLLTVALLLGASSAAAQTPPRVAPRAPASVSASIPFGMTTVPPLLPAEFRLVGPRFFAPERFESWLSDWSAAARQRIAARTVATPSLSGRLALPSDASPAPVGRRGQATLEGDPPPSLLPDALAQHADLAVRVVGRGELGGSWTRYTPCDPSLFYNCNPSLFPHLRPDVQFGVLVGGTISDRVHVDVDYDQTREFDASNNISVYYQGLSGELLQRVEVGDVAVRLPRSRYLTHGIPAGNFGFMASGGRGPLEVQAVWAQQKGDVSMREFRLGGGAEQGLVQDQTIVLDDADYVRGQFFFLVDPAALAGTPHVDALMLRPGDAPAALRPARGGTIQLYRDERLSTVNPQQRAQLGYFLADALTDDAGTRHTGLFRRLIQDQDYTVHASGLWVVLRAPLRSDEALAVAYVTETGEQVGTLDAERAPAGTTPLLRLLRGPATLHQPGTRTWPYEMHQVYRVDASGTVDVESIELTISLGERAGGRTFLAAGGRQVTFLRLFGLDEDAPADRLDAAQVYQPARDPFGGGTSPGGIPGTFLVLPTLRPFAAPPPVPAAGLSAEAARALLGTDANAVIYDDPDPVAREGGGRFRLTLDYRVRVEGVVSTFNLGAFGVREGSERLRLGERELLRGTDYEIDYDVGTIMLLDAATLFTLNPGAEIRATWEQKSLFQVAPTSVFGLNARYGLGTRGELNLVGLYQSERQMMARPQLGTEPGAMFLGGVSGSVDLGGTLLDRVLGRLPFLRAGAASAARLTGEVALSAPNPNTRGDAYLDDFEATEEIPLSVRRQDWRLGARPQSTEGAAGVMPFELDVASAARLVWQHDVLLDGAIVGTVLPQRDLDRQITVAGAQLPEPAMWLSFGGDPDRPHAGGRAWRSITTVLSPTGRDMSRSEYLEFYVRADQNRPLALVLDIGTVGEDAFYFDRDGNTSGVYPDGRRWGLGVLDEEASLADREVWAPDKDRRGLWDQDCLAEPLTAYPLGDPRANCTRGNGLPDTEDLDGNGILDADDGPYFRYVVELDRLSPYLVRDTAATGTRYRLYRIPLRTGAGTAVNGANDGTWRFIKHLRMTVVGEPPSAGATTLTLARLGIIGARWSKRDVHGINRGLLSDLPGDGAGLTRLRTGPVSRVTDGAQYSPPPGVIEQLQDPSQQFGIGGVEFNEKSLRIAYDDLLPGDRAEVFFRYPQQPRNFLSYGQIRLWAVARGGHWGGGDGERLVVKVGTDPRNYYLYQTPLRPATGPRPVTAADWLPEVVIDFDPWFELKARAERRLIERGPAFGADTLWSDDGRYAIVFEDRARAPNLAAIRELSFGVYNAGIGSTHGEVWIDDMRLGSGLRDPGVASHLNFDVRAGDFVSAQLSYAGRGAVFHQLHEEAGHVGSGELSATVSTQLDRLLPETWGVDVPLSVTHVRSGQNPSFLERSDVRADRLDGLRTSGSDVTRVALTLRRRAPAANPWVGLLLDGAAVRFGYTSLNASTVTSRSEAGGYDLGVSYRYEPVRRDFGAMPHFVGDALRALAPRALEESDAFQRLVGARLRWSPRSLSFGTSWFTHESRAWRFERILEIAGEPAAPPTESPRLGVEQDARIAFAPFDALTGEVLLRSHRDLLDPERAANRPLEQAALRDARARLGGVDLGWETNRTMTTNLTFRPRVTPWLRPSYSFTSRYNTDRNPSYLEIRPGAGSGSSGLGSGSGEGGDTAAVLQRRFLGDRNISRMLTFEPVGLFDAMVGGAIEVPADTVAGTPASTAGGGNRAVRGTVGAILPVTLNWNSRLGSSFERETFAPNLGFQLGLGDLSGFRIIDGDTAVNARARDEIRLGSGLRLPAGAQLEVSYSQAEQQVFDLLGGARTQDERGWPNLRFAWLRLPVPARLENVIGSASLLAGYERLERTHRLDGTTFQDRGSDETRIPVQLSIGLAAGLTTSYNAMWAFGGSVDPTGQSEQHAFTQSLQVAGTLQPPEALRERMQHPLTAMLGFNRQEQLQCRFRSVAEGADCVPFLELNTRSVNLTLETILSDLTVGMQMSYVGRQSHVGTRAGSNQFQLGLFGQFNFEAGRLAPPGAGFGGVR